jgi:hypothetical protein
MLVREYRRYFNLTSQDVWKHLVSAATPSTHNFFDLLESPDLYGPLWVTSSVVFLTFALGNLTNWIRTRSAFHYNFSSLTSAFFVLNLFVFGAPPVFSYLGDPHSIVNLMTLFGYSTVYIVPPALLSVVAGRTIGIVLAIGGALGGAISIANKTGLPEINALPDVNGHGAPSRAFGSRLATTYFVVHLIVFWICFF